MSSRRCLHGRAHDSGARQWLGLHELGFKKEGRGPECPRAAPEDTFVANGEKQPSPGAREADVEEAALLFHVVECGVTVVWDQALLDANDHAGVELQALGAVQREAYDLVGGGMALVALRQHEMVEKLSDISAVPTLPGIGELDQLLDVVPAALGLVGLCSATEVRTILERLDRARSAAAGPCTRARSVARSARSAASALWCRAAAARVASTP